jgi:hypothetical protein
MITMRETLKTVVQSVLLLLLALCGLFWLAQAFLFLLSYFQGGWSGVQALIGHLMISNRDPSEWSRWNLRDFVLNELYLLAFTFILLIVNRRILRQFNRGLRDYVHSLRHPRTGESQKERGKI